MGEAGLVFKYLTCRTLLFQAPLHRRGTGSGSGSGFYAQTPQIASVPLPSRSDGPLQAVAPAYLSNTGKPPLPCQVACCR